MRAKILSGNEEKEKKHLKILLQSDVNIELDHIAELKDDIKKWSQTVTSLKDEIAEHEEWIEGNRYAIIIAEMKIEFLREKIKEL